MSGTKPLPRSSNRRPGANPFEKPPQGVVEVARRALEKGEFVLDKLDLVATVKSKQRSLAKLFAKRANELSAESVLSQDNTIRQEIDALRGAQRKEVVEQLAALCHSTLKQDLNWFSTNVAAGKVGFKYTDDKDRRRRETIVALRNTLGIRWPATVDDSVQLCAYDCVTIAAGPDEYATYMLKTADLRVAQQNLLSGAKLNDSIDTALLCTTHEDCMASDLLSVYDAFEMHSEPFVASTTEDVDFATFCHTKYGPENPMPKPEWGMWGDRDGRIVRAQLLHTVEEFVLQMPGPNWSKVQFEFRNILRNDNGKFSGDWLMEMYDGELAAEFTCLLWRVIHADKGATIVAPTVDKMPLLPDYVGPDASATYEDFFPRSADASPKCQGRAYVRRLVYTALTSSWFLRSPLMPTMLCSIERAATTPDFQTRSTVTSSTETKDSSIDEIMYVFRQFVLRLSDGRAEAASRNATALFRANAPKKKVSNGTASTNAPFNADEWFEDQEDSDYVPSEDDDDGPDDPSDYGGFSRYRRGRRCKYILSFCFFFQNWKVIMLGTALSMTVIGYWYDYQFNRGIPDRVFIIPTMLKNIIMGFGRGITEYVYKPAGDAAIRKGAGFAVEKAAEAVGVDDAAAAGDVVENAIGSFQQFDDARDEFVRKYVLRGNRADDIVIAGGQALVKGVAHVIVGVKDTAQGIGNVVGVGSGLNDQPPPVSPSESLPFYRPEMGAPAAIGAKMQKKLDKAKRRADRLVEGALRTPAIDLTAALALAEGTYGDDAPEPYEPTTPVSFHASNMNGFATAGYAALMADKRTRTGLMTVSYDDALKIVGDDDLVKESVLKNLAGDLYAKSGLSLVSRAAPTPTGAPSVNALRIHSNLDVIAPTAVPLLSEWGRASAARRSAIRKPDIFPCASTHF